MRNNKERIKAEAKEKVPRRMSIGKRIAIIAAVAFSVLAMTLVGAFSFAYFSKKDIYDAYMGGNVQLLFAKLTLADEAGNTTGGSLYQYQLYLHTQNGGTADTFTYAPDAEWGSERNPYIISEIKHLYNLSELQNVGFFEKEYINKNYDEVTGEYNGGNKIPYFRVCNEKTGQPVCIAGGDDIEIETIGTEELPFIGSIQGAFATGTCDITTASGTKTSEVSAIHGVQMIADDDSVDVGLFGHITCLGDPTTADETTGEFAGYASVVSNLLLSDVKVKVQRTTFTQWIAEGFEHIFFYTPYIGTDYVNDFHHETNHLGILAGHVTYSNIEYISVYYSASNIVAIDLRDNRNDGTFYANYHSDTGIIGFVDELNPLAPSVGTLKENSGVGSEVTGGALGGGGGDMSGEYPGYMLASAIYSRYSYQGTKDEGDTTEYPEGTTAYPDTNGTITISDARKEDGTMLCQEWENGDATNYYFWDRIFTFAVSTTSIDTDKDVIEPTWANGPENNKFSIGENSDDAWRQNNLKGAFAVHAYLREVPIQGFNPDPAKKYYIFSKKGDQAFLINLSKASEDRLTGWLDLEHWGGNRYDTSGMVKSYADYDFIENLWESSDNWPNYLGTTTKYTLEEINSLLNDMDPNNEDSDVIALNIGVAAQLDELLQSYEIDIAKSDTTYSLSYINDTDSSKNRNFYFLERNGLLGTSYHMYCNSDYSEVDGVQNSTLQFSFNPSPQNGEAAADTNAFTISASIGEETRYLYQTTTKTNNATIDVYNTSTDATTVFFLYELVTSQNIDEGVVTYDPETGTTSKVDLAPNEYVFFANSAASTGNADDDNTYNLIKISDLPERLWQDGEGNSLASTAGSAALAKKFTMKQAIKFGVSLNLDFSGWGLPNLGTFNSNGLMTAQVGNPTSNAIIPKGCVAFRVDKATDDKKIRVIVAVPISEYYRGQLDDDDNEIGTELHYRYLNMWHLSDAPTGLGAETFNAGDYLDRFAIPNSRPYDPKKSISDATYINVKADIDGTTGIDSDTYRCYLNGDRVLIAYEFTITKDMGTGIFILGTTGYSTNVYEEQSSPAIGSGTYVATPMEIVYFSADGIASEGHDGNNYSPTGTIDFVYDNASNSILTVDNLGPSVTAGATPDYATYYYPSYSTVYFDNEMKPDGTYVRIHEAQISLRRQVDSVTTEGTTTVTPTIYYKFITKDNVNYIKINNTYFSVADELKKIEQQPKINKS